MRWTVGGVSNVQEVVETASNRPRHVDSLIRKLVAVLNNPLEAVTRFGAADVHGERVAAGEVSAHDVTCGL